MTRLTFHYNVHTNFFIHEITADVSMSFPLYPLYAKDDHDVDVIFFDADSVVVVVAAVVFSVDIDMLLSLLLFL